MAARFRRHPLAVYFVLTNVISWAFELPLVANAQGWAELPVPMGIHYLASVGPMLSAIVLTAALDESPGLREILGRMFRWSVGLRWACIAALSPVALFALAAVVERIARGAWPELARLGDMNYLPDLGAGALALWIVTFGFGEETGWRGYALPRLQRRRSALSASLILAGLWVVWHVPSFFYIPSYTSLGIGGLAGLVVGIASGSILLTWLYNSTQGSILMVALWHGLFDFFTASEAIQAGSIAATMSIAVIVGAIVLVAWAGPSDLARSGRQVYPSAAKLDYRPVRANTPV